MHFQATLINRTANVCNAICFHQTSWMRVMRCFIVRGGGFLRVRGTWPRSKLRHLHTSSRREGCRSPKHCLGITISVPQFSFKKLDPPPAWICWGLLKSWLSNICTLSILNPISQLKFADLPFATQENQHRYIFAFMSRQLSSWVILVRYWRDKGDILVTYCILVIY